MIKTKTIIGIIVWLVATLFVVYSFALNTAAAVFSESIKNSLHASSLAASIAVGAFVLGFALMQIPAGYLLDRYKAKWVVSGGVLILALGNLITSFANHLIIFTASNFLQGMGASFAFIAAGVLISRWFELRLFPILFGLTQTISCICAGILHYFFSLELQTRTWNDIYQKLSIFGFILFVLCLLIISTPRSNQAQENISLSNSLKAVFKNNQIVLCAIAAAFSFGILLAYASLWYSEVQKFYAVPELDAVVISGMIFAGIGIGTPILGWVSNRLQSRKVVLHVTLVIGTMALLAGIYLPHYQIHNWLIVKTVSFLIGFFLSGSMLYYTVVAERSPDQYRGVALSVTNTAVFLLNSLMMIIPLLMITSASKGFFTYLWVLPFAALIAILLNYFIKETYQKSIQE